MPIYERSFYSLAFCHTPSRISRRNSPYGDVSSYHSPRSDDCSVSNSHTFQYNCSRSYKDATTNLYGPRSPPAISGPSPLATRLMEIVVNDECSSADNCLFPNFDCQTRTNCYAAQTDSASKNQLSSGLQCSQCTW